MRKLPTALTALDRPVPYDVRFSAGLQRLVADFDAAEN
jgi:hypothetical protein